MVSIIFILLNHYKMINRTEKISSVLDIFSYVPKQKIDLEQLETIFVNEINNVNAAANGYYVENINKAVS